MQNRMLSNKKSFLHGVLFTVIVGFLALFPGIPTQVNVGVTPAYAGEYSDSDVRATLRRIAKAEEDQLQMLKNIYFEIVHTPMYQNPTFVVPPDCGVRKSPRRR